MDADGTLGWSVFWQNDDLEYHFPREIQVNRYPNCIAIDHCLSATKMFRESRKRQTARGYESCGGEQMLGNAMERGA